jgi:hypothetical protein
MTHSSQSSFPLSSLGQMLRSRLSIRVHSRAFAVRSSPLEYGEKKNIFEPPMDANERQCQPRRVRFHFAELGNGFRHSSHPCASEGWPTAVPSRSSVVPRFFGRRAGLSLVEVMIAVFIMAIAFFPILRLVDFGSVSTAKINNYSRATRLAQQLIEECKHVPFKVYQREPSYANLADGVLCDIHPQFYKKTGASIEQFVNENKGILKEFGLNAQLRFKRNALNQVQEIWLQVEIKWRERGKLENETQPLRVVRAGNAMHNAEAL